jgi:hypothetical protein
MVLALLAFGAASAALLTGPRVALGIKGASAVHPLALTQTIASLAEGTKNGLACTDREAAELGTLIGLLEEQNPTADPAESALLDGDWKLLYTSTKGGSAGKLGPFVGRVNQLMELGNQKYTNVVKVRGAQAALAAHWDVLDACTWRVFFDTLTVRVLGRNLIKKPFPEGTSGIWRMTYLDTRIRILRARGEPRPGAESDNDEPLPENVYVLTRVD